MNRIWLASNAGNQHINELIAEKQVELDRLKVGPFMGTTAITLAAASRPILLHISQGVAWPRGRGWVMQQVQLSNWLKTPWISFHLEFGHPFMNFSWRWRPIISRQRALDWAIQVVSQLTKQSSGKILVENMSPSHYNGHPYLIDPSFISQVVREADCFFLLDLAHARIAAQIRQEAIHDYLQRLPLDKVIEIHVSGPRSTNGRLEDAHDSMQKVDYELLSWALTQTQPQAVTLEYWEEKDTLKEQLHRLRGILDAAA